MKSMAKTKKMNESFFAQLLKDLNSTGELIRARQDEKQGLLDEFDSESKRFFFGKISERALASSVRKTNKELYRLDGEIRKNITKSKGLANRIARFVSAQAPYSFKATLSGIVGEKMKKSSRKKTTKKKVVKKKVQKKTAKKTKKKK